jgi:Ala-tRNA(Pro) deacylase
MRRLAGRLTVVLDAALLAAPLVNFHPLRNDATTAVSPEGLLAFLRGLGHTPLLFDFRRMAPI